MVRDVATFTSQIGPSASVSRRLFQKRSFARHTRGIISRLTISTNPTAAEKARCYCNFAYSALASFRMGMSGSASFQRVRKSW
jgi:hypothetical protein